MIDPAVHINTAGYSLSVKIIHIQLIQKNELNHEHR